MRTDTEGSGEEAGRRVTEEAVSSRVSDGGSGG